MEQRIASVIDWLQNAKGRWRGQVMALAIATFCIGTIWSIINSGLSAVDLAGGPILLLMLAVIPATIAYSAINMMLMAHAARVELNFTSGVRISAFAQIAELLPIPGGAIVRTAALMRAGAPTISSAELVVAFALLWIACGGVGAGLALAELGNAALVLTIGSAFAALAIAVWLGFRYGLFLALAATALRVLGVGLMGVRLALAFAAVGYALPWIDAGAYAFAAILGSASAIVPAGLGLSEALSALIAAPSGVDPATAFLAAALSRLLGFGSNMLLVFVFLQFERARPVDAIHG